MVLQLTDYAIGVLASNPSPVLDIFRVGSAFGYVPLPTDTDIRGTLLYSGQIAPPVVLNANTVKYVTAMDTSVGDFEWGETGFYHQGQLFALAVADTLALKRKVGADTGNSVRLDAYLTVVGTNYAMIVDQADSSNQFMMASLSTIDQLPPVNNTRPNAYIISAASSSQTSFQAITDRSGLWSFDAYQFADSAIATVVSADIQSVTLALADYSSAMTPSFFGQVALQFSTGINFSICRYVKTAIQSGQLVTLGFETPMASVPVAGDKFRVYRRVDGSSELQIPIATASLLGGIKIGTGLLIDPATGICTVDTGVLASVTSVNGKTGVVTLEASDILGIATVGRTGSYNDLLDKPAAYALPIATTTILGGVTAPANGNLVISNAGVIDFGFIPVKTINGVGPNAQGNIEVVSNEIGLVRPIAVPNNADLNTYTTTGLFTVAANVGSTLINGPSSSSAPATLEVVPTVVSGTGFSVQRYTTASGMWWRAGSGSTWGTWQASATQAVATTTSLGVVQIGAGLSVNAAGVLSWSATSLPLATATTVGVIKVGSGLAVDAQGTLSSTAVSYTLPVATTTQLGGIRVGTGLSIDGTGILKSNVQTVNGTSPDAGGNVTVPADATKLNRINGAATGLFLTFLDQGTKASGAAVAVVAANANVQRVQFTGGISSWTYTWPASGTYAEVQMEIQNGGLATHVFPAAVRWINPDGTLTTIFSTYMANKRNGATNFQTSGVDFAIFWSRDGGTTIYAMVL